MDLIDGELVIIAPGFPKYRFPKYKILICVDSERRYFCKFFGLSGEGDSAWAALDDLAGKIKRHFEEYDEIVGSFVKKDFYKHWSYAGDAKIRIEAPMTTSPERLGCFYE